MIEMVSIIRDFPRYFRLADAVDIAVIAVFLYSGLLWFRETASRRVVVGVTTVGVLYFLARTFDLYLTSRLLHAGFAILLIVLVVIFQEDLRRAFERIATMGTLGRLRQSATQVSELDTLVEVTFGLAEHRIGALIVIKGQDELDRHVEGGIELGGAISKPLLDSIFDPSSAGHDGAALIRAGRVSRFAAHLPISNNRREIGTRGTRHAAALGISERCDALTIAVSEERGQVTLASNGHLEDVSTPAELKGHLEEFVSDRFPFKTENIWRQFVVRHWPMKAVSILLAMIGWILFAYNPSTVQRTFVVPIEYRNIPDKLELDEFSPTETRVTLSGTEPAFRFLEPATLKISIDLDGVTEGAETRHVDARNLSLPANLSLYRIEHGSILVSVHQRKASQATGPGDGGPPSGPNGE